MRIHDYDTTWPSKRCLFTVMVCLPLALACHSLDRYHVRPSETLPQRFIFLWRLCEGKHHNFLFTVTGSFTGEEEMCVTSCRPGGGGGGSGRRREEWALAAGLEVEQIGLFVNPGQDWD